MEAEIFLVFYKSEDTGLNVDFVESKDVLLQRITPNEEGWHYYGNGQVGKNFPNNDNKIYSDEIFIFKAKQVMLLKKEIVTRYEIEED